MDFCLLSKFDDLFSDIFLDAQFLWFDTIKLNNDHRRPRIRSDKVLKIIQDKILPTGKTNEAVKELLRMDYFKHYLATKSAKQQQEFIQHMKRYLYMYMPNAGYEIADTRRYGGAGRRVEACVTVTKDWKTGDEMRLCTGMIAHMEPHQEHELKKGNRDISVMWSTRKQCNCLFLGPARFVNHDCDPNAKFISLGPNSVTFKIIKDISCGDELTAFYGKHYFGENNCECRCATCETKQTGYFASEHNDEDAYSVSTEKEEDTAYRRSSRKRKSALHDYHETEHLYRNKRSSSEIQRMHPIELEELIGVLDKDEEADIDDADGDNNGSNRYEYNDSPAIKLEQDTDNITAAAILPVKQEMDEDERPKVMSIHFLCNESSKQQQHLREDSLPRSSSVSHSPLDLLCNAVLDAEYLNVRPKQEDITVVVSSNIHRDAKDRVMRMSNQYTALDSQQQQQQHWRSMDDEDSTSDTKADSAVGFSPDQDIYQQKITPPPPSATNIIETNPNSYPPSTTNDGLSPLSPAQSLQMATSSAPSASAETQWQHDMGSLFDDEQLSDLDDFMDDVSDLSSVCSSDSALESIDSSSDENLGHLCTPSPSPVSHDKKKRSPNSNQKQVSRMSSLTSLSSSSSTTSTSSLPDTISKSNEGKSGLDCVACGRTLNSETVSDPSAADVAVANELATWTWSPSAAFADWRPQRCPRCERHVRVFNQEWPARNIKKSTTSLNLTGRTEGTKRDSTLIVPPTKAASNKKRPATTTKKYNNRKLTSNQYINSFKSASTGVTRKQYIRSPPTPTSEIFGGVEDLF